MTPYQQELERARRWSFVRMCVGAAATVGLIWLAALATLIAVTK